MIMYDILFILQYKVSTTELDLVVVFALFVFMLVLFCFCVAAVLGWLGSRVVSVLDSCAEGPGSNRSRDAVG